MDASTTVKRTHLERVGAIFAFIEQQADVFPKSKFKEIGLNPRSAETWLTLIEFIQNQPRIRLVRADHNLLVERTEGRYQALMRKMSIDPNVSFEQRQRILEDYLKSLHAREQTKGSRQHEPAGQVDTRTSIARVLEALEVFCILDPGFEHDGDVLKRVLNASDEEKYLALSRWQKDVLLNDDFKRRFHAMLAIGASHPRSRGITRLHPDFPDALARAKSTIRKYYTYLRDTFAGWMLEEADPHQQHGKGIEDREHD